MAPVLGLVGLVLVLTLSPDCGTPSGKSLNTLEPYFLVCKRESTSTSGSQDLRLSSAFDDVRVQICRLAGVDVYANILLFSLECRVCNDPIEYICQE